MSEVKNLLTAIYEEDAGAFLRARAEDVVLKKAAPRPNAILCAYPDHFEDSSLSNDCDLSPISRLDALLDNRFVAAFDTLHLLPFFPSSGDGGYAVIDHHVVDRRLGSAAEILSLSHRFDIMGDLILNHVSPHHRWFADALNGDEKSRLCFIERDLTFDVSKVARPRNTPIFSEFHTSTGPMAFWTTYGPGQIDLDYRNPDVLAEMVRTCDTLSKMGLRHLRLDAAAFIWKVSGDSCANLPEAKAICRLIEWLGARPNSMSIVSETDAGMVSRDASSRPGLTYRYDLAPALAHSVLFDDPSALAAWLERIKTEKSFEWITFLATHDGLYLRPQSPPIGANLLSQLEGAAEASSDHELIWRAEGLYEITGPLHRLTQCETVERRQRIKMALTLLASLPGVPMVYLNTLLDAPAAELDPEQGPRSRNRSRLPAAAIDDAERHLTSVCEAFSVRRNKSAFTKGCVSDMQVDGQILRFARRDRGSLITVLANFSKQPKTIDYESSGRDLLSNELLASTIEMGPLSVRWIEEEAAVS